MENEDLDKNGLMRVWLKIWTLLKLLVGDVDVDGKGDLQTQINNLDDRVEECFQNASDGKKLVADAISGKGIPTLVSDTFATIAANIAKIKTSANLQGKSAVLSNADQIVKPDAGYDGLSQVSVPAVRGTANTGDVLAGKTFSGAVGVEKEGTMTNRGAWTGDTTDNGNVAIPAGYHNGQGYVSGAGAYNKGISDADARANTNSANYKTGYNAGVTATKKGTADAGDVLVGKTFTNATTVEEAGAMANKGAVTVDSGPVTQDDTYTYLAVPSAAFYNANSKLRTLNSNIKSFFQTQLQVGAKNYYYYEQLYVNNGCQKLNFASDGNQGASSRKLTIYGSNNGNTWDTLISDAASGDIDITGYRFIKIDAYGGDGYGALNTYSLTVS